MNLRQIKGNTFCLEGDELIPLYKTDEHHCILLDSGLFSEREALTSALKAAGLTPVGVLGSHAHRDHWANSFFLRETYGTRLSLPEGEAALCLNPMLYRAAYDTDSPQTLLREYGTLVGRADETVGPADGTVLFCGVPFEIFHTPGHTPDHICTVTPDGVFYVGDALLAGEVLAGAKLPYHYTHETARATMETLRGLNYTHYIVAHRAVVEELDTLIDANLALLRRRDAELVALVDHPMTLDEVLLATFQFHKTLTSQEEKAARYARNVRTLLEYLQDSGRIALTVRGGMRYYQRTATNEMPNP